MARYTRSVLAVAFISVVSVGAADAEDLRGSRDSMIRQNTIAKESGYSFVESPPHLEARVAAGELVEVPGNGDYDVAKVRYPYARPEVRLFIERLGAQYRESQGSPMVVTSLTRPLSGQPSNASPLSVHPAGMAVDLRVPADAGARSWLESTLLSLEARGVLDVTREYNPPHYHVAVYPEAYAAHAKRRMAAEREAAAERRAAVAAVGEAGDAEAGSASAVAGAAASVGDEGSGGILPALASALALAAAAIAGARRRELRALFERADLGGRVRASGIVHRVRESAAVRRVREIEVIRRLRDRREGGGPAAA